ncbi:bcl2-associated agonist of cell death [Hyla sarda]|uniref:bcl2-associated agonist of cell death n=1 Tax=Hyla sarda TaxID=327740 RepID=UPI0024C2DB9C|nr:bcl2-associated agonist of cell death [Hyla sarda]XP_056383140.1 bcl2-associated agonist of cell death [Hyla sarda]
MADSPPSIFSISEFPPNEQGAALPGTDPMPSRGAKGYQSSPNLRRGKGIEPRSRTESASESQETDRVGELNQFRSRSRSAPSSLMVAARYGRELRRMSDEFDKSFMGLPRPKSAGAAAQMAGNKSFREILFNLLRWKSKDKNESESEKN